MRRHVTQFREIPNVGKAIEKYFPLLGIEEPGELITRDPYQMYDEICKITNKRLDPCLLDVFISAVKYMQGEPAKKWWEYTQERKLTLHGK